MGRGARAGARRRGPRRRPARRARGRARRPTSSASSSATRRAGSARPVPVHGGLGRAPRRSRGATSPTWRDVDAWPRSGCRDADLAYSLAYDLILPPARAARRTAPRAVNLHRGIAPDFRGAYSTTWALARGAARDRRHAARDGAGGGRRRDPRAATASRSTPETTAAEAIPAVEALAVSRCAGETLRRPARRPPRARPAAAGGRDVRPRGCPATSSTTSEFPGLAARAYGRCGTRRYPSPYVDARRAAARAARPSRRRRRPPAPAALAPAAVPRVDNRPALTFGRPVGLARDGRRTRSRCCASGSAGRSPCPRPRRRPGARRRAPTRAPTRCATTCSRSPAALAAASAGAAVLLAWPFGRPPDPAAVAAVAAAGRRGRRGPHAGAARHGRRPRADWVLLAPGATFDVGPRGVLLAPAGAELVPSTARWTRPHGSRCAFLADLPAARGAPRSVRRRRGRRRSARAAPGAHWPLGTVAHRYPVLVDDARAHGGGAAGRGVPAAAGGARPARGTAARAAVSGRRRRRR